MNLSAEKPNRRPIRLCSAVYDAIDSEAAYRGEKAGTIANRILADELDKVAKIGIKHCVVYGSNKYRSMRGPTGKGRNGIYFPQRKK